MPDPYIPKEPNDLIRAADWNQIQIDARTEIQTGHDHSGGEKGVPIGTEGIADGAVTAAKLAGDVSVGVEAGAVGEAELADGAVTLAKLAAAVLQRLDTIEAKANQALELAQEAKAAAVSAQSTADSAKTKANVALSKIDGEVKEAITEAKGVAQQALTSAVSANNRITQFHGKLVPDNPLEPDFEYDPYEPVPLPGKEFPSLSDPINPLLDPNK